MLVLDALFDHFHRISSNVETSNFIPPVSKPLGSRYVSGKTRAWLKTKNPKFERPWRANFFGDDLWRVLGTKGGTESGTDQAQLPHRTTGRCPYRQLNSDVMVVQSLDDRQRENGPDRLDVSG